MFYESFIIYSKYRVSETYACLVVQELSESTLTVNNRLLGVRHRTVDNTSVSFGRHWQCFVVQELPEAQAPFADFSAVRHDVSPLPPPLSWH